MVLVDGGLHVPDVSVGRRNDGHLHPLGVQRCAPGRQPRSCPDLRRFVRCPPVSCRGWTGPLCGRRRGGSWAGRRQGWPPIRRRSPGGPRSSWRGRRHCRYGRRKPSGGEGSVRRPVALPRPERARRAPPPRRRGTCRPGSDRGPGTRPLGRAAARPRSAARDPSGGPASRGLSHGRVRAARWPPARRWPARPPGRMPRSRPGAGIRGG